MSDIDKAVLNLYGGWDNMPNDAKHLIKDIFANDNLERLFQQYRENEKINKNALIKFEKEYPGIMKEDNLKDIITALKAKKNKNI